MQILKFITAKPETILLIFYSISLAYYTVDAFIFVGTNFPVDLTKVTHSWGSKFLAIVFSLIIRTENHYFMGTRIRGSDPTRIPRILVPHEN